MDDQWYKDITKRVSDMEVQHSGLKRAIEDNTAMTVDIKRNTDDIVVFFQDAKGTFKALQAIGNIAKWCTAVAGAVALFWLALKSGGKP
jgi:hypothetical protein